MRALRNERPPHLAYCSLQHSVAADIFACDHMVSWRSLDLSPNAGIEVIMHGGVSMSQSNLANAYDYACMLHSVHENEQILGMEKLKSLMALMQAVPAGLGSGKSGLRYKLRAMQHSARLFIYEGVRGSRIFMCEFCMVNESVKNMAGTVTWSAFHKPMVSAVGRGH